MSSVMIAADSTAIADRSGHPLTRGKPRAKRGASLLRRAQGTAAGLLFLTVRVPIYVAVLLLGALASLLGAILYLVQAVGLRLIRPAGAVTTTALALVCIAGPRQAHADAVNDITLLQQTTLINGKQSTLDSFDAPGAGTLSITLKDWSFPVPLQQLTASILSQDEVLGSWDSSKSTGWSFDVPISGGGVFDAFIAAQAGTFDGLQLGTYSMSIIFEPAASPVPLPSALDLLLGGMGLLGAVTLVERLSRRRNTDVISVA